MVAEWTKATVLKTVDPQGSVGSNPTRSARLLGTYGYETAPETLLGR